jgi:glycosyltransferase involved in cell wall biosynthesis
LVYVGSLTKGRGIEFLLEFAKAMPPNWRLVFVGEGPLADLVSDFASRLPGVHHVGPIRHDWLVRYISSADIGVCLAEPVSLSDELALPNKFFEYAFAGLPIVYSPFPEMELVGQSFNLGLSSTLDVRIFRQGVEKLAGQRVSVSGLSDLGIESQRKKLQQLVLEYTGPTFV